MNPSFPIQSLDLLDMAHNLKNVTTTTKPFDLLKRSITERKSVSVMVEGQKVFLTPNPYDRNLFGLYIGEEQRMSNSCHKSSMLKIIKEWEQGHRRIEMFEDGGLLMKNYVGRKP